MNINRLNPKAAYCAMCGKKLIPGQQVRFCSDACRDDYLAGKPTLVDRLFERGFINEPGRCIVCGQPAGLSKNPKVPGYKQYCSPRCTKIGSSVIARLRRAGRERMVKMLCAECGNEFEVGEYTVSKRNLCDACLAVKKKKIDAAREERAAVPAYAAEPQKRLCHTCRKRKCAPGSYWCEACKAKRLRGIVDEGGGDTETYTVFLR